MIHDTLHRAPAALLVSELLSLLVHVLAQDVLRLRVRCRWEGVRCRWEGARCRWEGVSHARGRGCQRQGGRCQMQGGYGSGNVLDVRVYIGVHSHTQVYIDVYPCLPHGRGDTVTLHTGRIHDLCKRRGTCTYTHICVYTISSYHISARVLAWHRGSAPLAGTRTLR